MSDKPMDNVEFNAEPDSTDAELKEAVAAKAKDGGLACAQAMELANKFNVAPIKVGAAANALKIKIRGCQLGCFR